MEKFGVENIKKAIGAVINIGENVEQARDDGEVSLGEAISITVGAIPPMFNSVKNWNKIREEYNDLSNAERQEIKTWVQEEFDLEDDFVESKIEAAFDVVVSIEKYFSIKRVA